MSICEKESSVYETPNLTSTIIGSIYEGQQYEIVKEIENNGQRWQCIRDPSGNQGYIVWNEETKIVEEAPLSAEQKGTQSIPSKKPNTTLILPLVVLLLFLFITKVYMPYFSTHSGGVSIVETKLKENEIIVKDSKEREMCADIVIKNEESTSATATGKCDVRTITGYSNGKYLRSISATKTFNLGPIPSKNQRAFPVSLGLLDDSIYKHSAMNFSSGEWECSCVIQRADLQK